MMGIFGWMLNLANTIYTYLASTHPVTIPLVYFILYFLCGYFVARLKHTLVSVQVEGPYFNPKPKHGKGKHKYTPNIERKRTKRKRRYKGGT